VERNCWNPLFAVYWAGKSDIRTLTSNPEPQFALTLCRFYNGLDACCPLAFEEEQQRAFDSWVEHWKRKVDSVRQFQADVEAVRVTDAFVQADYAEQARYERALESFGPVLSSYGTCFDALLEYMSGVLCFTCDPHWHQKVFMDGVQVAHLRVHESSHEALWAACKELGAAATELRARTGDSALVKAVKTPFENLEMFETKIGVSEYMARHGLYAMRGPIDRAVEEKPERALAAVAVQGELRDAGGGREAEGSLHPVRDGRASGFNSSVFPRDPLGSYARRAPSASRLVALVYSFMILSL